MFATDSQFEDEVRRIARLLWPSAEYDGAAIEDGRERDGVFETPEFVHVIECTVSRAKDKARDDAVKLSKLLKRLAVRHPTKFLKGWFVTLDEPTADQRTAVKDVVAREKHVSAAQVVAVSFDQFRAQLVDARSYLDLRRSYPFGSVRNPVTGDTRYDVDYVTLQILDASGTTHDVFAVARELIAGQFFVLQGDYGAGKSATLRQLFLELARRFWKGSTKAFPVLLNLRDHHGQIDPVEALERHARKVGFSPPSALVRAWRGGFVVLLLDGFDEIAAAGWAGKTRTLKELRYRSMELVRSFIRESPPSGGAIVAGRAHFFDGLKELQSALGLKPGYTLLALGEFTEDQVRTFLGRGGWSESVPAWLPSRPLLLSYLAARNLLSPASGIVKGIDPAAGWDSLLDRIAHREAELEAGIDPDTVRRLIERVAMLARNSVDALGPVPANTIIEAFAEVCGYPPDDRGSVLLQRLPGLGAHHSEDGSRVFIDKDFAEAARGSAVSAIIQNPYGMNYDSDTWQSCIAPLAAQVAAHRLESTKGAAGKVVAAMRRMIDAHAAFTIAADLFVVLLEIASSSGGEEMYVREVIIPVLEFEDPNIDVGSIELQDSIISYLNVGAGVAPGALPRFVRCHIGTVEGRTSAKDLPAGRFVDCDFDSFEERAQTTNAILALALPPGTRVMLTVLKKLYAQAGGGRKESALYRGLDSRLQALIPDVLALLKREGMIIKSTRGTQDIWLPTRTSDSRRRALSILATPHASSDRLVTLSNELG